MKTIKKTAIHRLTVNIVEIDSEQYIEIEGKEVKLDTPKHSTAYVNSPSGRERLQAEQPENIITSVLAIWGTEPTVEDPKVKEEPETPEKEEQQGE